MKIRGFVLWMLVGFLAASCDDGGRRNRDRKTAMKASAGEEGLESAEGLAVEGGTSGLSSANPDGAVGVQSSKDAERSDQFPYVKTGAQCDQSTTRVSDDYKKVARITEIMFLASGKLTAQEESDFGREFSKQLDEEYSGKIDINPARVEYVRGLGQRLLSKGSRAGIQYVFHVVEDETVNAFATPGGNIYVFAGLLAKMENEAQLATVVAHEIGHVEKGHGSERLQMARKLTGAINDWTLLLAMFLQVPTSSKHEEEADAFALDRILALGYSPFQAVRFFEEVLPGKNTLTEEIALTLKTGDETLDLLIEQAANNPVVKELENLVMTHPSGAQRACRLKQWIHERIGEKPPAWYRVGREDYVRMLGR